MGSNSSKTASSAVKTASKVTSVTPRKYPTRPSPPSQSRPNAQPSQSPTGKKVGPAAHPQFTATGGAAEGRPSDIEIDTSDPDRGLAARLSQLGPVQPNPTYSNSSTFRSPSQTPQTSSSFTPSASTPNQSIFPNAKQNPAVSLLTARYRLAEEAELEFSNVGRKSAAGRQFLDVVMIRQILVLREKGMALAEIEKSLGLRGGVVARLGRRGVVEASD